MKRQWVVLAAIAVFGASAHAQENLFSGLNARALGPTVMGGRICDIAVYEKEPRIFYIATASGGIWKTDNGGMTTQMVFGTGKTAAAGAIAVNPNDPNDVWVGMGEASSRNSTSWGDGVYHSSDGGKTWTHMGLAETHHISKIVIDPNDPKTVYVGALGRLWGENPERGLYKTTDGGKTWNLVHKVNTRTGVIDLVMDPKNPKTLMVAMWERIRYPWNFISGGEGSGIYKSTDAGKSWKKVTKGMPEGMLGRVGLSYFRKDSKVMVATMEASTPAEGQEPGQWRRTPTGGTFRSTDGGESWSRVNTLNPRPFYFSMPRQDPNEVDRIYVWGVSAHLSTDGGKTFRAMPINDRVHVDYHACWINPNDSNHIIVGNDGGVYQSRDKGVRWEHLNTMDIGQFYAIGFDFRKPYYVYGGLQDNNSWGGPTQSRLAGGVFFNQWTTVTGGDGFYTLVDPNDWSTVYSESQGGALIRRDMKTGASRGIQPRPNSTIPPAATGERYRFNWQSPLVISPHNSKVLYFGGNKVFKSPNRGDSWLVVSPDLTTDNKDKQRPGFGSTSPENTGAEMHCTVVALSESPVVPGYLWAGTDDGRLQVTTDDGKTWSDVYSNIPDLPKGAWCSRVVASAYDRNRAFATFDNHRSNDFGVYVYMTEDLGKTWKKITNGIGANEPVHVVREGTRNSNLLVLGTEAGLYVSVDRGANWTRFRSNEFPTVPVHDLAIHPRELDLIIGTHGRSLWTLNVAPLEEMTPENMAKDVHLTTPQGVLLLGGDMGATGDGDRLWVARNSQPATDIAYYLKSPVSGDVKVEIQDAAGARVQELNGTNKAGLNVVRYNARGARVRPGDFTVVLKAGGKEYKARLRIEEATWEQ